MPELTIILSYYSQPEMLRQQLSTIRFYPKDTKVIIVDDGSPVTARSVIDRRTVRGIDLSLYRIIPDIPWNRSQARNLGTYKSITEWVLHVDIDHILPVDCVNSLLNYQLDRTHWYRFQRHRVGRADATRQKDQISPDATKGKIHPHHDCYLIRRDWFMDSPYDERYSGCLGGGTPFIQRMIQLRGEPELLPDNIYLQVYTMNKVKDASVNLDRDTTEYTRRREQIADARPEKMLCHPWDQVI
jgi:hypothetical protein